MFMLPEMDYSLDKLEERNPVYGVYCIKIIPMHGQHKVFNYIKKHVGGQIAVFKVKACKKSDVYELFTLKQGIYYHYGYAFIDSYDRSVMMNDLFRHIPENHNLDKIEESDDEIELEDISYVMEFEWTPKFKKWIPIKVSTKPVMNDITVQKLERSS